MIFSTYNAIVSASVASIAIAAKSAVVFAFVASQPPAIEAFASHREDVSAGDVVPIEWNIRKRVDCIGVSMRVWRGEDGFKLREPTRPVTISANKEFSQYLVMTDIPDQAPSGWLRLEIEGVYDCPTRRIPFTLGPVVFKVSDKEEIAE